jgi:hypothetical protein
VIIFDGKDNEIGIQESFSDFKGFWKVNESDIQEDISILLGNKGEITHPRNDMVVECFFDPDVKIIF